MRYTENFSLVLYDVSDKWSNQCWNSNYTIIDKYIKTLCDKTEKLDTKNAEFTESVKSPHFIGNADTASAWKNPINLTIGNYKIAMDGSKDINLSLDQIGASPVGHTHPYLPLAGGTMDNNVFVTFNGTAVNNTGFILNGGGKATTITPGVVDTPRVHTDRIDIRQIAATTPSGIWGICGNNDMWRVVGCAADDNIAMGTGYLELATGDDGTEPIYARQYNGVFGSINRTLTLLDESGNTLLPGTLKMAGEGQMTPNGDVYIKNANGVTGWLSNLLNSKSGSNHTHNYAGSSSAGGSANSAVQLQTARNINGTSFNGTSSITTAKWGTARSITIGNTKKTVDGSADVSWTLAEIGASASSHTHSYLPLTGGTLTGDIDIKPASGEGGQINV